MEFRTYRQARTWVCLLAAALARWALAAEPNLPPQEFHVPPGDATRTLTDFSRQAHLQLLFDYNVVIGHATPPLDGTYTPTEALHRLLGNTDLQFDFVNERTLAVMQRGSPSESKPNTVEPKLEVANTVLPKSHTGSAGPPSGTVEVVRVTGTYVRDEPPIGEEVISASLADIEATGAATPADFLRTLPQTFGGGPNQDTHIGLEALTNSGLGVGVNLRGLGARATLVLIDGHRVAPSGTQGQYVDIENIPLSAIQRIDILPDSVSSTYGADAVGGVVNFVLRKRFDGAETILRGGSGTRGDLQEYLLSQTLGRTWSGGEALLALELYDRGALPAADRAYATSDLRPFGGGNYDTNFTNPGNIINPQTGQTWAIPAGQDGRHLTAADLAPGTMNLQSRYVGGEIIPRQERWTLYGSARQALTDHITLFSDVLLGHRESHQDYEGISSPLSVPNTNPFYVNPTGGSGPVIVAYNFGKDLGPLKGQADIDTLNATGGLDFAAGHSWIIRTYAAYSRERQSVVDGGEPNYRALTQALADSDPLTAFNPFGDGSNTNSSTLRAIQTEYSYWLDSQLEIADVMADGPVATLAGVPIKLALGADWRDQRFASSALTPGSTMGAAPVNFNLRRRVVSAFGQVTAPFVTEADAIAGLRALEFSAAARYEEYQGYGNDTTPKLGLVWSPFAGVAFRGTWSRSARPPTLVDLDTTQNRTLTLPVALPGGGVTNALLWTGGNTNIQPEHAQSWTIGLDLAPDPLPGLSLGLTYFRTAFKDRLQDTPYSPSLLVDPAYSAIVTHNPTATQIAAACIGGVFAQGSTAQCMSLPVGAIVDLRVRNLARLVTDGIDFNTTYVLPTGIGQLKFILSGTWLKDFLQSQTPDQPLTSLLNTQNQPIDLKMRASAAWASGGWGALVAANFTDGYRDTASIPRRRVASWTTIDVQIRYDFAGDAQSWLHDLGVELNARNVFNVDPPFLNNQATYIGYDQENADPYGRLLSLQLRKKW